MEVRAVFIDRDGTIIEDVNYLRRIGDIRLLPGVPEALGLLHDCGFELFVVTNQSGVGRGYFSEDFVKKTHIVLNAMLGGAVREFFYCPHRPEDGCNCRKPKPGMIDIAVGKYCINRESSYIIGDKWSDAELGINSGIRPLLVGRGEWNRRVRVFGSLLEAAEWICRQVSMV